MSEISVSNDWVLRRPKSKQSVMLENIQYMMIEKCNITQESILFLSSEYIAERLAVMKPNNLKSFYSTLKNSINAEYQVGNKIIKPILSVQKSEQGYQVELNPDILAHWCGPLVNEE